MFCPGKPNLFHGPLRHTKVKRSIFSKPIEAQYIRLEPQTWKHAIALQFDVLGCREVSDLIATEPTIGLTTTTAPTITTTTLPATTATRTTTYAPIPVDVCTDQMGFENGLVTDGQITFSSWRVREIRLGSPSSWIASHKSRKEYVRINLLEVRNVSGVVTQGNHDEDMWIESYSVRYSKDGVTWFTILDSDGNQRIFDANVDSDTAHTNLFERIVSAQYIEIVPWQWHGGIALRMDLLGCYLPTTTTVPPTEPVIKAATTTTALPESCRPCPNIPDEYLNLDRCSCAGGKSWDGEDCVNAAQCPCFENGVKYQIGSIHESEDCSLCTCQLGGVSECRSKVCQACEKGLVSRVSKQKSCQCTCEECPTGERLCQSSNVCLEESLWCNGVEDCPDDELDCVVATTVESSKKFSVFH